MDLNKFECQDIYIIDETGCTTVSAPQNVVAEKGVKQIGSITSAQRGQLVTAVYGINAAGSIVPSMIIFTRKNFRDHFIKSGPPGCIGGANSSGWINEELFLDYLKHFIRHTRSSTEHKVLLIHDNHETHITLAAIDLAKANGVVLLTMPPHTSHRLQPLDVSCFKPFKTAYGQAMENWMRSNPGKTISIYEIPEICYPCSVTWPHCKKYCFRISKYWHLSLYNRDLFGETEFSPAMVTDRDAPVELIENVPVLGEGLPVTPLLQSNQFTPVLPQSGPNTSVASVQPQPGPTTSVTSALTQPGSNIYVTSVQPQPGTNTSASSGQPQPGSKTSGLPQPGSTTSVTSGLPQPGAKSSVTSTLPQLGPSTSVTLILAQPGPSSSTSSALAQTDSCSSPPPQLARMAPHVSPADIIPFPKAGPRKNNTRGRKRGDTKVLTNIPVRDSIANALSVSKKRKANQPVKPKAKKKCIHKTDEEITNSILLFRK